MRFAFVFPCAIAVVLAGCVTRVRVTAEPGSENLSGSYVFAGIERARPDNFPNPLIDWGDVALHSHVRLEQSSDERLAVRYRDTSGNLVEREIRLGGASGVSFKDGELRFRERVPLQDAKIFPGWVKQFAGARYLQDQDGNLRVIGFFTERGLMLFLIPFIDHYEYDLVLEPVDE